jgi:hypothetical protein
VSRAHRIEASRGRRSLASPSCIRYRNTRGQATAAANQIPVKACHTVYGQQEVPATAFPGTEPVALPRALASQLAYYSDHARSIRPILGPRGWSCSAAIGADESVSIQIYPHGASASGPESVEAHDDAPCVGCMYDDACPLIPHAAAELRYPALPCPSSRPPQQTATWVVGSPAFSKAGHDVVSFTDPPGVKGYGIPSGGPYYAKGMIIFSWGPGTNSNISVINCALPAKHHALCAAILSIISKESWTSH